MPFSWAGSAHVFRALAVRWELLPATLAFHGPSLALCHGLGKDQNESTIRLGAFHGLGQCHHQKENDEHPLRCSSPYLFSVFPVFVGFTYKECPIIMTCLP